MERRRFPGRGALNFRRFNCGNLPELNNYDGGRYAYGADCVGMSTPKNTIDRKRETRSR